MRRLRQRYIRNFRAMAHANDERIAELAEFMRHAPWIPKRFWR